jgi:hypothetical protein
MPKNIENIMKIAVAYGAHVTIQALMYMPHILELFAQIGGNRLTIIV